MTELGFVPAPYVRDFPADESQNAISAELLANIDADVILAYSFGATEEEVRRDIPAWDTLDAVREGRVHFLPDLSLSAPSVLSIPHGIDELLPFLQTAVASVDR